MLFMVAKVHDPGGDGLKGDSFFRIVLAILTPAVKEVSAGFPNNKSVSFQKIYVLVLFFPLSYIEAVWIFLGRISPSCPGGQVRIAMPIFEYDCLECGEQFEHLQRKADNSVHCPACGKDRLRRLVSLSSVSSEARSAANLRSAHQRAAAKRHDKQRSEHVQHHEHFGDVTGGAKWAIYRERRNSCGEA